MKKISTKIEKSFKVNSKLNTLLAYIVTFLYFLIGFLILKIVNSGLVDIRSFLIYYVFYGSIIVMIGCLIIEYILQVVRDNKTVSILFVGFLYGIVISFLLGISNNLDTIFISFLIGIISSLGLLIYSLVRRFFLKLF